MLDLILTSLYYLIAATLWYVIYLAGRAVVRRFRIKRHLAGLAFLGLTTFLVWGGLALGMLPGSMLYRHCYYAHQCFGKVALLGTPRFSYDSERDWNGDGCIRHFQLIRGLGSFSSCRFCDQLSDNP